MAYVKKTIYAGNTIEVEKYHTSTYLKKSMKRNKRSKATSEQQEKINEKNAVKQLRRLLNANFKEGDWHIVLTYNDNFKPASKEQAKRDLDNFLQSLRRLFKKENKILKYIAVTEYKRVRIHHHLVISQGDALKINRLWKKGWINYKALDGSGNYHKLADYLIKETRTTFRAKERVYGKRWNASSSIEQPIIEKEVVKSNSWRNDPVIIKGYFLDKDSVQSGVSSITSYPYQYYTLIKIKEVRHGKTGKTACKKSKTREKPKNRKSCRTSTQ